MCLGEAICYLFLFYSFIISVALYSNELRLFVFLHLAWRGRFFLVSRYKHTYTYSFFSLLSACYVTIFVRFITASISVSTALLAFLPRVLSLRAWHWLTPAVRFALLSIFLCPFLLFKLIFRLFHFSRRPPTSLSVYIKLSLLLLACLLLYPEIKSLSRRVLLISYHLFLLFQNPSSII